MYKPRGSTECQRRQKQGGVSVRSPRAFPGSTGLSTCSFLTSVPKNYESVDSIISGHLVCGTLWKQPYFASSLQLVTLPWSLSSFLALHGYPQPGSSQIGIRGADLSPGFWTHMFYCQFIVSMRFFFSFFLFFKF